jgi:general stress protein YciG
MPTRNYSTTAITEPDNLFSRGSVNQRQADEDNQPILAKEPDRQSATRRGTTSSRGRSEMGDESEPASQNRRSGPRSSQRRATQARQASMRGQSSRRASATQSKTGRQKKSRRGFAAMSPEQQREIARKGGLTVSRNRRHMADIGRVGGEHSHGGRRARR